MFRRDLHKNKAERLAHLAALEKRAIATNYRERLEFFYEGLSILDSKASSLLTFNAVGLTALAIWLANIPVNFFHVVLDFAFLGFLASCIFCLAIVWLHWVSTPELNTDEEYSLKLLEIRDARTVLYRWAWLLAVLAVIVTGLASLHHTFETVFTVGFRWLWNLPADMTSSGNIGF